MKHWIIYAFEVETESAEDPIDMPVDWSTAEMLTTISEDDQDKVLQIGASSERPGNLDWDYEGI